jgi:hypothetical protein
MSDTKAKLIATLTHDRQQLLADLEPLSTEQLNAEDVVGTWSIKNVLAHLTAWENTVIGFLPDRIATGKRPTIYNQISEDEENAQVVQSAAHLTPQEQLATFASAREDLLHLVDSFDEATLDRDHPWPSWDGTVAEYILAGVGDHEREHREAILAAIQHP